MSVTNGEVDTPLGPLACSMRANKTLTAYFGNFIEPLRQLAQFNFDAYVAIAAAGLNKDRKDVEEKVFEAGLPTLTESFSEYITALTNGGRLLTLDEAGKIQTGEA